MRIGFVLCEHRLDVRIKKEARSLAAAGHEVVALVQEQPTNQRLIPADAITVQTYALPKANTFRNALTFFKRMSFLRIPVEQLIEKFAVENQVDVLHVHDLPNVGAGIRVGRRLGIPLVADLHEYHPAAVRIWVRRLKPRHWITTNQTLWHSYEKRCVQRADQVIVVIEESRERLLKYGISPEKVHVVANYVDLDYLAEYGRGDQSLPQYAGNFVISYIGGIGPHRGVDTAIRAMAEVAKEATDARLLIVGDPEIHEGYLRGLIDSLGVHDSVELVGWQPFEKVPAYVAASHIGLVPHRRNPHCDHTIPNKLFDYMGFGKPVIVSDCPPLVRTVNDAQAGLVFRADYPHELAGCILRLYRDRKLAQRLGSNGMAAVESQYNWNTASAELVKVYELLEGRAARLSRSSVA